MVQMFRATHTCHWLEPCNPVSQLQNHSPKSAVADQTSIRVSSTVAELHTAKCFNKVRESEDSPLPVRISVDNS